MAKKPVRLHEGDTVALIAPASAPPKPEAIDAAVTRLEALGFRVKLGRRARDRHGFLAGDDKARGGDLMTAFTDKSVKGIFCVRGGYGTGRLLRQLDYAAIAQNPKVFVGYSDITALHCAFLRRAGLISFHGPMLASDLIKPETPQFAVDHLLRAVMTAETGRSLCEDYAGRKEHVRIIKRGRATGPLIGGNLSLLCTVLGTPWQPNFKGAILFLEELDERPYGIDRNLTHLLNAGALEQVAGVALGQFTDCEDPKAKETKEYRQSTFDVFKERLGRLGVPIVFGLPFGHIPHNAALPVGARATLNGVKGDLIVEEAGVK